VSRPLVIVTGPDRDAISGVSTHLNLLFGSSLAAQFSLLHFRVGSEGRDTSRIGWLLRTIASPWLLAATILARGAAVVHLNTSLNARAYWRDLAYLIVAKICGARVLWQVHGGMWPQQFCAGRWLFAEFLRETLRLPDAIAVLAKAELAAYRRFVPSQQVLLLPNGIDCAGHARPTRSPPDPAAPLRLVFIGRLVREKGVYEVLRGMRMARNDGIQARLAVAGSGPEEVSLRQFAAELGIAADVSFHGHVGDERKSDLLAQSDVLVLASYGEGLPYALLESMAAGVPVIATRTGAIPDVAIDGVHGFLVAPQDANGIYRALAKLSADRAMLERMGDACRNRVAAGYSIERLSGELCRLYSGLHETVRAKAMSRF